MTPPIAGLSTRCCTASGCDGAGMPSLSFLLLYRRALVVIVECLYRSYKPTRPTAAQPTPAMTQSNWIHAVGGGGNKRLRHHPKHRRPPDPEAEASGARELSERRVSANASLFGLPSFLPWQTAPFLHKPSGSMQAQPKERERVSKANLNHPLVPPPWGHPG